MEFAYAHRTSLDRPLLLTAASVVVVFKGASDEPYSAFRIADAVVQVGLASAHLMRWLRVIGHVAARVLMSRMHP